MQYPVAFIVSLAMFFSLGARERLEIRDSFEFEPSAQTVRKIHWPKKTIEIALSNSLLSPGSNIKPDSDVVGAVRRALMRWSNLSNINFVVTWSTTTSISPADAGGTEVAYEGDAQVGGTIAAVGQRLIDGTAKTMIKKFFDKLATEAAS